MLVVGGGATGCGVALDATTRGLRIGLIKREDFSSGTSSGPPSSSTAVRSFPTLASFQGSFCI
jgi:glycine/D-amino acid oxidase-like deaminating enzyme